MRGRLSEQMFQELHECEKETMPFTITSDLQSLIGKKLMKVYEPSSCHHRYCDILVFEGDVALWLDKDMNYLSCISLVSSHWREKTSYEPAHAATYLTDECNALLQLGLITIEQVSILLNMAKSAREQQHKEELEEAIQRKRKQLEELENEFQTIDEP